MREEFISNCEKDTISFAKSLSKSLTPGSVISLFGDLGVGKTHFVKGIAEGLEYKGDVTSPTFNIVNEYLGGKLNIYHFDMYRITGWDDLYSTGYFEYIENGGVVITEWSENIEGALPADTIKVTITRIDDTKRKIVVER